MTPPWNERLPAAVLAEGYHGKILLIAISDGERSRTVLRSGGRWHRDILAACAEEIRSLGSPDVQVCPRGGAYLCFEPDGSLFLWGRSDEFGTCDYGQAASLLKSCWPDRKVACPWGEIP